MFIEIEDLQEDPLHVQHVFRPADLPFEHRDATLEEPVALDLFLTHKDRDLRLGGTVETVLRCRCCRCLREFSRRVSSSFDLLYLPQPEKSTPDMEIELKYDDMDVGFYDGVCLDVDLVAVEQIELSLPMRFICREECRGLCYRCGANLNEEACLCAKEETDSRMAALLEFRKRMRQ